MARLTSFASEIELRRDLRDAFQRKTLETLRAAERSDRSLKVEFAHLKLLPREYEGRRHIVSVSRRPTGRCEYEERPGAPPPNQQRAKDGT